MTKTASSEYMREGLFGGMQLTEKGAEVVAECGSCKECPFREMCKSEEVYYSCSVWENSVGEDL